MHVNVKKRRLNVKWYRHISRRKGYRYVSSINVMTFITFKWFCGIIGLVTLTFESCYRSKECSHILSRSRPSSKFVITSDRYKTNFNCKTPLNTKSGYFEKLLKFKACKQYRWWNVFFKWNCWMEREHVTSCLDKFKSNLDEL